MTVGLIACECEEQFAQNALNTLEPLVFLAVCMYAGSSIYYLHFNVTGISMCTMA